MGKIFESTPSYQKGLIGEEIVKKLLESRGICVRRPADTAKSGASVLDFFVEDTLGISYFVEVKVKSPKNYAYGRFQVYTFPKSQIKLYKNYIKEKNSWVDIYIVDEEREKIFVGNIEFFEDFNEFNGIEYPIKFEDKTFPVDIEHSNGIYHYYNINQFYTVGRITGVS
ncbi:MAG: hypothetical protein IK062_10255 [Selenomonadaceae bacterium]|nr:hypothetical protein [Selenomonadaceae bacterium]